MSRLSVMVKLVGESRVHQMDVPAEEPAGPLASWLAMTLGWTASVDYTIEVFPPGRTLAAAESLADAQCPNGTWIVLHPPANAVEGYAWRRVDDDSTIVSGLPGYVWKLVDDDTTSDPQIADDERSEQQSSRLVVATAVAGLGERK